MTSKCRPPSLPWSTSVLVEYSPVAKSTIQTRAGDHAEDHADDGDDHRDVGLIARRCRARLARLPRTQPTIEAGRVRKKSRPALKTSRPRLPEPKISEATARLFWACAGAPAAPRWAAGRPGATPAAAPAARRRSGSGGRNSGCTARHDGRDLRGAALVTGVWCVRRSRACQTVALQTLRAGAPRRALVARVRAGARAGRAARLGRGLRRALPPPLAARPPGGVARRARRDRRRGRRPGGVPRRRPRAGPLRPPPAVRPVAAPDRRQPRHRLRPRARAAARGGRRRASSRRRSTAPTRRATTSSRRSPRSRPTSAR